ncbi:MAG: phosphotransferase [Desulfobulbaceae bacterium]|nr:MAG: phosphotransferase [Desulfobulbaceae bacterium]
MGITTYLFHSSNDLEKQRYDMFFLDMGENIHFHYRDLRIELSVEEFRELAELFTRYSGDVLREIEAGYTDGVLANTNETNSLKTFWDKERKLLQPVKYNECKLAVEETRDGYHLHIRNYKILLQKESFRRLVKAIAPILPLLECDNLQRDPIRLLEQNELGTRLLSRQQTPAHEEITVEVDSTYRNKAGQVLKAIGYVPGELSGEVRAYTRDGSTIRLVPPGHIPDAVAGGPDDPAAVLSLSEFLARDGQQLDAAALNQLKLKILALFAMARDGRITPFGLAALYVDRKTLNPTVDMFREGEDVEREKQLAGLSELLTRHRLFFVKPAKELLSVEEQERLQDRFVTYVTQHIASRECVRKIFILGSSATGRAGRYKVPFVHFDWVKIKSDFDIFVELDPDYDGELPAEWEKKFYWPRNGSDYYHFGDIGDGMASEWARRYPGVRFYEHLIEGYVFHYARGDQARRDKWFSEIETRCIFVRDRVGDWLREHYPFVVEEVDRIKVESFNKVYRVASPAGPYVLKVYDSKYLDEAGREKVAYEIGLLDFLAGSGLEVSLPVKNSSGEYISYKDRDRAVLFSLVPGHYVAAPGVEEGLLAGDLLARFHVAARNYTTHHALYYSNKKILHYWLDAWEQYRRQGGVPGTDIDLDLARLKKRLRRFDSYPTHCHGDLSAINYLFDGRKCWLIDFQGIGYGPALVDLANGMIEFAGQKGVFREDTMHAFRQGYERVRKLLPEEEAFLNDLLVIQAAVRQAKLLRLHYGGFGYELKEDRILGLRAALQWLLAH